MGVTLLQHSHRRFVEKISLRFVLRGGAGNLYIKVVCKTFPDNILMKNYTKKISGEVFGEKLYIELCV